MNNYEKQAQDFLTKTSSTLKIELLKDDFHFNEDKDKRDIYQVILSRGNRFYSFNFGNSLNNSINYFVFMNGEKIPFNTKQLAEDFKKKNRFAYPQLKIEQNKNFKEPTAYDILACLTTYDPGTFEEFCDTFGYNDLPLAKYAQTKITYDQVVNEYNKLVSLYSDKELELLSEIQ